MRAHVEIRPAAPVAGRTPLRGSPTEGVVIAQVEGANAEACRVGHAFLGGILAATTGIAPTTTVPTTTATIALYNAAPVGGPWLYLDSVNFVKKSGTPAGGTSLLMAVSPGPIASAPAAVSGWAVKCANGSQTPSVAHWATSVTFPTKPQDGANPAWLAVTGFAYSGANSGNMGCMPARLLGGFAVPPRFAVGFVLFGTSSTTPLYSLSAMWHEW